MTTHPQRHILFLTLTALSFLMVLPAVAAESSTPFIIDKLWIGGDGSYRVASTEGPAQCTGGPTNPAWSYVLPEDAGSKGKMAALLSAYHSGKTIHLSAVENVGGYCHIIEFWVY